MEVSIRPELSSPPSLHHVGGFVGGAGSVDMLTHDRHGERAAACDAGSVSALAADRSAKRIRIRGVGTGWVPSASEGGAENSRMAQLGTREIAIEFGSADRARM